MTAWQPVVVRVTLPGDGAGVIVCRDASDLVEAIQQCVVRKEFGDGVVTVEPFILLHHVCGLQGFGALGDVCEACRAPSSVGQAGSASSGASPSRRQHPSAPPAAGSREATRREAADALAGAFERYLATSGPAGDKSWQDMESALAAYRALAPAPEPRPREGPTPA